MEATFAMLNVPKTVGYYLQFGLLWNGRFFGYEKNIMKSVCKWVKIHYFLKLELLIPTTIAAAGTSCRHQILTAEQRHYIQFLY
jgi:hypothetical protein